MGTICYLASLTLLRNCYFVYLSLILVAFRPLGLNPWHQGPVFVSHWAYMLEPCAWRCSIGSSLKVRTVESVVVSTIDNQVCVKHYDTNKRFTSWKWWASVWIPYHKFNDPSVLWKRVTYSLIISTLNNESVFRNLYVQVYPHFQTFIWHAYVLNIES